METFYKLKTTTTTKLSLSSSRTTKEKSISGTSWNVDCILKGWVRSMKWLRRSSSSFLTTSSSSSNLSLKPFIRVSDTSPNCWKKSSNEPCGLNFEIANLLFKILSDQLTKITIFLFVICEILVLKFKLWHLWVRKRISSSVKRRTHMIRLRVPNLFVLEGRTSSPIWLVDANFYGARWCPRVVQGRSCLLTIR